MAAVKVATTGGSDLRGADVMVKDSSTIYFVYNRYTVTTINVCKLVNGTATENVATHTPPTGDSLYYVAACIDASGIIHIAYITISLGANDCKCYYITYNTSNDTFASSPTQIASTGRCSSGYLGADIEIDSNGKVHMIYTGGVASMGTAYSQVFYTNNVSGSWLTPEQVSSGATLSAKSLSMTLTTSNYVEVMWSFYNTSACHWRRRTTSWGTDTTYTKMAVTGTKVLSLSNGTIYRYNQGYENPDYHTVENDAYITAVTCYVSNLLAMDAALVGQGRWIVFYVETTTGYAAFMQNTGSGWSHTDLNAKTTYVIRGSWYYNCNFNPSNTLYYGYLTYTASPGYEFWIDALTWGTSTKSSTPAYLKGRETSKGNLPAYTNGVEARSKVSAFSEGYQAGRGSQPASTHGLDSTKGSHASFTKGGIVSKGSIPSYMKGNPSIKVAVVPFTARTSTGTQDITSTDLGGSQPKFALFFMTGATADNTRGSQSGTGARYSLGVTNGTNQWCTSSFESDGYNGGFHFGHANAYTTSCVGLYYIGPYCDGRAEFNSWINNGVRINWLVAGGLAFKGFCVLIGDNGSGDMQVKVGTYTRSDTVGGTVDVDCGFNPDLIFHSSSDCPSGSYTSNFRRSSGFTVRTPTGEISSWATSTDWDAQTYQAPNWYHWVGHPRMAHSDSYSGLYYNDDKYMDKVKQWISNGFQIQCTRVDTTISEIGCYAAIKFTAPIRPSLVVSLTPAATGNTSICLFQKPRLVIIQTNGQYGATLANSSARAGRFGYGALTANNQEAGCVTNHYSIIDTDEVDASWWYSSKSAFSKEDDDGGHNLASRTSIDGSGITLNFEAIADNREHWVYLSIGEAYDGKTFIPAFLYAHTKRAPAFLHGRDHTKTNQPVYLIGGPGTSHSAYLDSVVPYVRSNKAVYTSGKSAAFGIAMTTFTCITGAGTQDVTTSDCGGETPKACYFIALRNTSLGTPEDAPKVTVGSTDGTHKGMMGIWIPHTAQQGMGISSNTSATGFEEDAIAFITNGIRITWSGTRSAYIGIAVFFWGTGLSANTLITDLVAGDNTDSTPGFKPDLLIGSGMTYVNGGAGGNETFGVGFSVRDSTADYGSTQKGFMFMDVNSYGHFHDRATSSDLMRTTCPQYTFYVRVKNYTDTGVIYNAAVGTYAKGFLGLSLKLPTNKMACVKQRFFSGGKLRDNNPMRIPLGVHPEFALVLMGHQDIPDTDFEGPPNGNANGIGVITNTGQVSIGYSILPTTSAYGPPENTGVIDTKMRTRYPVWVDDGFLATARFVDQELWLDMTKWPEYGGNVLVLAIGSPYPRSAQPAYINGCYASKGSCPIYLEGTAGLVRTSGPAFLYGQVNVSTSHSAYAEGYQANVTSSPAYCGGISSLTRGNLPAYCFGNIASQVQQPAFLQGSQDISTGTLVKGYLRGNVDVTASLLAYMSGIMGANSHISAYTRNGTDTASSIAAYANCSPYPASAQAAYTHGGGVWPFTDDFTGTDEANWNPAKWDTEEI